MSGKSIACFGLLLALGSIPAAATTVDFSYYGTQPWDFGQPGGPFYYVLQGSGSFSYSGNLSTVGLSDLTAFNASELFDTGHGPGSGSFTFTLSGLSAFDYTPAVPDLTLVATSLPGTFYTTLLYINGTGPNQVSSGGTGGDVTTATLSLTQTPEPRSWVLLVIGAFALALNGARILRRTVPCP